MKRFGKLAWIILKTVSFIALFCLLVSAFSGLISPEKSYLITYSGLFFPFILGFNLILLILCVLARKWKHVLFSLVVFILCSGSIYTYFPLHRKTKTIPENCIKILSYNVMSFDHLHKHTSGKPNPIIQYIIDCDADIVCLQEYAYAINNKSALSQESIIQALKGTPYTHFQQIRILYGGQDYGVAVFSKFPILKTERVPYDSNNNGSMVVELDIHGRKVTLINNHLESNQLSEEERLEYYDMTKEINTENLEAFTHKMHKRLTPAYKKRAKQAELISSIVSKVIAENENPYIIVCGDFNDTPLSYTRYKIKGDLKDAFVDTGSGMGITYNRHRFLFRIDYILHSKNIKAYNCTVGKGRDSDHYPIYTYLEFLD
jgi:endonuclease/exonuclease/phosphatase family metal-dependent hydrolase